MSADNRKRSASSIYSGKRVCWPSSFLRQPARVLIVESLPPWWSEISTVLCDALDNFLSLACGLDGPCRIPLLSLYAISRQQECLLPFVVRQRRLILTAFIVTPSSSPVTSVLLWSLSPALSPCSVNLQQVRGNLARLRSCVEELRSIPNEGCVRGTARGSELLRQAVLDSLQQFKQYIRHTSITSQARGNISLEVML